MTTVKKTQSRNGWIVAAVGAIAIGSIGFGIAKLTLLNQARSDRVIADIATSQPQRVEVVASGRLEPQGELITHLTRKILKPSPLSPLPQGYGVHTS
jgi:HlyD family secretion protein